MLENYWNDFNKLWNLDLNCAKKCFILASNVTQPAPFSITDANLNVPVVTLLTQGNGKLLE